MELDQEKQNQEAAERCRALAQRVVRELAPRSVQVLEDSGLLEKAFCKMNTAVVQSAPELLVVADPQWVSLPAVQAEKVLLVCAEYAGMADCAKQLAAQGFCRELAWKDRGKEQLTALFCRMAAPELPELEDGYEQQLDVLRERSLLAERTAAQQAAQLERLRSDLSLSRSHEQELEKTLNSVVNSTFWKASWPLRYLVSKCRQLWRTFPLFVFFATLRRVGFAGVMAQAKAKKEYKKLFPGKAMPADRFADVELLVKQAADQPAAPLISIVVPLYNTPHDFLVELLDSVQNQTYRNWELCMVDAGQDADVGALVQERARTDSRIRYRKLDSNEGIAGNTNQGFALATGEYIALLDHDDILHPCALWYVAEAIAKQGADFVYTDEVTFEGDIDHLTVYHFKPDYMLDNLRSNNYICHLSVFSAALLAKVGGDERAEFNGSQDYDLYLRLTEQAEKIVHIPHLLYYWRSSPASVASNISAKTYCLEAAMKALRAHYDRMGVPVDAVTMVPNTPGFYKTDYTITKPGRVSVLIPSCDHSGDLRVCVESIYRKTTYPDFEVIIIENNSTDPATFAYYEKARQRYDGLKVVTYPGKGFNFSAINNFGRKAAQGEYLLLLNNDVEVRNGGWLTELLRPCAHPGGAAICGAMLYYPDETLQHAGVVTGLGGYAGHSHKYKKAGGSGYMFRTATVQDFSAVTGACLLVKASVWDEVNGLDEKFAVAFNDVDFCLRVRDRGYRIAWTPYAQLTHYESKSRGGDEKDPAKAARFAAEQQRLYDVHGKADIFHHLSGIQFCNEHTFHLVGIRGNDFGRERPQRDGAEHTYLYSFFACQLHCFLSDACHRAEGYNQVVGIIAMNFLEANLILFYLLVFGLETDVVLFHFFRFQFQ